MNAFVIRTPTDFRPTIYSNDFSHRVLANLATAQEPILEKALHSIFNDLTYLNTSDPNLVSAYVKRIQEPLRVVDGLGLAILALVSSSVHIFADGTLPEWNHVYYLIIPKHSFFRVEDAASPAIVHRYDPDCRDAMSSLMLAVVRNESISTWPDLEMVVIDQTNKVVWCRYCCEDLQPSEQADRPAPIRDRLGNSLDQRKENQGTGSRKSIWGTLSQSLGSRLLNATRSLRGADKSLTPVYTKELGAIELRARQIAIRYQHESVDLAHLLLAFIEDADGSYRSISPEGDPGLRATRDKVQSFLEGLPKGSAKIRRRRNLRYTRRLQIIVDQARTDALRTGASRISPARLFLALASEDFYSEAERGAISQRLLSPAEMTPRQIERKLLGGEAGGSAGQLPS